MTPASEVLGDTGYVDPIPTGAEAQLSVSGFRFFYKECEIRSFERRKYFIDELRSEFVFPDVIPIEYILCKDSSHNHPSFKGNEVFEYMPVELKVIQFLAFIGVKDDLFVFCPEGDEFARHLENMGVDAVFETIGIPDDSEKEEGSYLRRYNSTSSPSPFS